MYFRNVFMPVLDLRWRIAALCLAGAALAPAEAPLRIKQGDTLRLRSSTDAAATAQAPWKDVRFFADPRGGAVALLPIPVRQDPGRYTVVLQDAAGKAIGERAIEVADAHFLKQNIQVTPAMKSLTVSDEESKIVGTFLNTVSERRFWSAALRKPAAGCMNSPFGVLRFHNGVYAGRYHGGLDFRAPAGAPVRTAEAGIVRVAHMFTYRGGTIGIDHGQGLETMYLHLSRIVVKEGQEVKRGELIGRVGATGFATGPHLHWSVFVYGTPVNPRQWTAGVVSCYARRRK